MKPIKLTKLKIVIFAGVITVFAGILISVLINQCTCPEPCRRNQRLKTSAAPAKAENIPSKPVQPSLIKPKLASIKKEDDANVIDVRNPIKPVLTAMTPPFLKQKTAKLNNWAPNFSNENVSSVKSVAEHITQEPYLPPREFKPLFEDRPMPMITSDMQRHNERYKIIEDNQRIQITPQQQEQMRKEMLSRIPERYGELFKNIEQMKAEQLAKSRQAVPQVINSDDADKLIMITQDPNAISSK